MSVAVWMFPGLFVVGMTAGCVDAIAGGGGLLTVPALLWAGLPVPVALGTNKLQSSVGTALATWRYGRAGLLRLPGIFPGVLATLVGACIGVGCVHQIDPTVLRRVLPFLLVAVAIYFWTKPELGDAPRAPKMGTRFFAVSAGLLLGFYDGFFGPGTGSFWMIAAVGLLGLDLRHATGWTKAMNLTSNLASLALFLRGGLVNWEMGLVMAAGQLIGAHFGAGLVLSRGRRLVRPVFLTVVMMMATKLAWDAFRL